MISTLYELAGYLNTIYNIFIEKMFHVLGNSVLTQSTLTCHLSVYASKKVI